MAGEKRGEVLENQLAGDWQELDKALEDLDNRDKTRALEGLKRAVEIINQVFVQLES